MPPDLDDLLLRWTRADVIDLATADRIRAFEREQEGSGRLRWPILVALAFGALLIGAGVLLFVAAHWDNLSPGSRFTLVLLLVAVFHLAAASLADRFPAMSIALHGIGTVSLGAGIFLAGQIFNLDEHWPGGLMLWAAGAAVATLVLGQAPQVVLVATLVPAWLAAEWVVATRMMAPREGTRVVASGMFLLALSYLTSPVGGAPDARRTALFWLGAVWLLPAAAFLAMMGWEWRDTRAPLTAAHRAIGWTVAVGVPLLVALAFRRREAWPNAVAAAWTIVLVLLEPLESAIPLFAWWALGAIGLVAWGVRDTRVERINFGAAIFAGTVIAFYFSQVMDKLGRSMSLVGLGLLFLGGGWALERARRRLISRVRGDR
jgi:uncharacterized membrane protein